jgi:hypothetical protein
LGKYANYMKESRNTRKNTIYRKTHSLLKYQSYPQDSNIDKIKIKIAYFDNF